MPREMKVYVVTAPFYRPNAGDSDYVQGISSIFPPGMITYIQPLVDDSKTYVSFVDSFTSRLSAKSRRTTDALSSTGVDSSPEDEARRQIVTDLSRQIVDDKVSLGTVKILNLQLRPPDNGTIFNIEDLELLKAQGIKLVVTCHEYLLNVRLGNTLNEISQARFSIADHIIFFNQQDRSAAIKDCKFDISLKTGLSQVITPLSSSTQPIIMLPPILVPEQKEALLSRPPNIIMFGSIRYGKGFEYSVALAEQLKKSMPGSKLIIAGELSLPAIVTPILLETYGVEQLAKSFSLSVPQVSKEQIDEIAKKYQKILTPKKGSTKSDVELKKEYDGKVEEEKNRLLRIAFNKFKGELTDALERLKRDPESARQVCGGLCQQSSNLPIELYFFAEPEQMKLLFNQCKYAFACDEIKGFANNASAMITLLAQGIILYANRGFCTPSELEQDDFKHAIQWYDVGVPEAVAKSVVQHISMCESNKISQHQIIDSMNRFFLNHFSTAAIRRSLDTTFSKVVDSASILTAASTKQPVTMSSILVAPIPRWAKNQRQVQEQVQEIPPRSTKPLLPEEEDDDTDTPPLPRYP